MTIINRTRSTAIIVLSLLIGCTGIWLGLGTVNQNKAPADALGFMHHFLRLGIVGSDSGESSPALPNAIATADLQPGDILVCHHPGSVYGYWSHATVYLGNDAVLGQDILAGIYEERLVSLAWYDEIRIYRPECGERTRNQVVTFARNLVGRPFHLAAHPRDPYQWNCAKIVVSAWASVQLSVGDGRFWPTPDAIAAASLPMVDRLVRQGLK